MANNHSLTNRLKLAIIEEEHTDWSSLASHWPEIIEVMINVLANKDYVINGLAASTVPTSLAFTYSAGQVSINGSIVDLNSGNGLTIAETYNWLYVQGGQVKLSTLLPTGESYVPLYCFETDDTGIVAAADLRPSPPSLSGITIEPQQVNPTDDINMAAGKRVLHADSNVSSNTVMFTDAQVTEILTLSNLAAAEDWTEIDLSAIVTADTRFVIINCYMATFQADTDGFAVLEVKTEDSDTDYIHNVLDYGHPSASVVNPNQYGNTSQFVIRLDADKKFRARTRIDSLGSGTYYAFIKLMGYMT
jgi:hypothetical protein